MDQGPVNWRRGWQLTSRVAMVYTSLLIVGHLLSPSQLEDQKVASTPGPMPGLESLLRDTKAWLASWAPLRGMPKEERLHLLYEENVWKNDLVMWVFPDTTREMMPHFVQTWLRCWILCAAVYFSVGGLWCYYCYFCFGDKLFRAGTIPGSKDVVEQIKVSNLAIPLYSLLPALTEYAAEKGYTMAYPRVENMGLPMYAAFFIMYMASVEFGVYWMHRGLHEIKWAYKLLHHAHHKYNKEHTLSPFAGLAFHPIDGILQAVPYTWTLFFCPMHFLTHEMLLFATGIWTTNIHDCIHGKVKPILGAGYHTIHHTTYKHNYGHYFTFVDAMYNTCVDPEEFEEDRETRKKQSGASTKAAAAAAPPATADVVIPASPHPAAASKASAHSSPASSAAPPAVAAEQPLREAEVEVQTPVQKRKKGGRAGEGEGGASLFGVMLADGTATATATVTTIRATPSKCLTGSTIRTRSRAAAEAM